MRKLNQLTFVDAERHGHKRRTRREEFLSLMDKLVPFNELVNELTPDYYSGNRGRPPIGLEFMLRFYFVQLWFNLSDEGVEDAVYDSWSIQKFLGIDLRQSRAPDSTTLVKFRKWLTIKEKKETAEGQPEAFLPSRAERVLATVNQVLTQRGVQISEGSIVDATIIAAAKSTKNREGQRDPEMHSTKKGEQCYFGMKAHIGVDETSGMIHTVICTSANAADVTQAHDLTREDDQYVFADAGYIGVEKRPEADKNEVVRWVVAAKRGKIKQAIENDKEIGKLVKKLEHWKAKVRARVEHSFLMIKERFGYRKVRFRGIAKNASEVVVLCSLANVVMSTWVRTKWVAK